MLTTQLPETTLCPDPKTTELTARLKTPRPRHTAKPAPNRALPSDRADKTPPGLEVPVEDATDVATPDRTELPESPDTGSELVTGASPLVTGASPLVTGASPLVTGANALVTGASPLVTGASVVNYVLRSVDLRARLLGGGCGQWGVVRAWCTSWRQSGHAGTRWR